MEGAILKTNVGDVVQCKVEAGSGPGAAAPYLEYCITLNKPSCAGHSQKHKVCHFGIPQNINPSYTLPSNFWLATTLQLWTACSK